MKNLIKLQLRNATHQKMTYICLLLTILIGPAILLLSDLFVSTQPEAKAWPEIVKFIGTQIDIVGLIFIAIFSCLDFSEGTIKNIISRGYSKEKYLVSKIIVVTIALFAMYIVCSLILFVYYIRNGLGFDIDLFKQLLVVLLNIITISTFYTTISVLLEKNSSAIIACVVLPVLIPLLLGLISIKFNIDLNSYWISSLPSNYLEKKTIKNLTFSVFGSIIYIFISLVAGNILIKKKEIK